MRIFVAYKTEKLQMKLIEFITGVHINDHNEFMEKMNDDAIKSAIGIFSEFIHNTDGYCKGTDLSVDNKMKEYVLSRVDKNDDDFEMMFGKTYDSNFEKKYKKCLDTIHDDYFILKDMKEEGDRTSEAKALYSKITSNSIGFKDLNDEFLKIMKSIKTDDKYSDDTEESWKNVESNRKYTGGEFQVYEVENYADMRNIASWTEWCVARKDGENHFNNYKKYGGGYYVFCKGRRNPVALMHTGSTQFKDIYDNAIKPDRPTHKKMIDFAKDFLDSIHFDYLHCRLVYQDFNIFRRDNKLSENKDIDFNDISDAMAMDILESTSDNDTIKQIAKNCSNAIASHLFKKYSYDRYVCDCLLQNSNITGELKKDIVSNGNPSSDYLNVDMINDYVGNSRINDNDKKKAILDYCENSHDVISSRMFDMYYGLFKPSLSELSSFLQDLREGAEISLDILKQMDDDAVDKIITIYRKCRLTAEAAKYAYEKTGSNHLAWQSNLSQEILDKISDDTTEEDYSILINKNSSADTVEKVLLRCNDDYVNTNISVVKYLIDNGKINDKICNMLLDKKVPAGNLTRTIDCYQMSFETMYRIAGLLHNSFDKSAFIEKCMNKDYLNADQKVSLAKQMDDIHSAVYIMMRFLDDDGFMRYFTDREFIRHMMDNFDFSRRMKKLQHRLSNEFINNFREVCKISNVGKDIIFYSWFTGFDKNTYDMMAGTFTVYKNAHDAEAVEDFVANPSVTEDMILELVKCKESTVSNAALCSGRLKREQLDAIDIDSGLKTRALSMMNDISEQDIDDAIASGNESAVGEILVNNDVSEKQYSMICDKFFDSLYICRMLSTRKNLPKSICSKLYAKNDRIINAHLEKNPSFSKNDVSKSDLKRVVEEGNMKMGEQAKGIFEKCTKDGKLDGKKIFSMFSNISDASFLDYCVRNSSNAYMLGGIASNKCTSDETLLRIIRKTSHEEIYQFIVDREELPDSVVVAVLLKTKKATLFLELLEYYKDVIRSNIKKIISVNDKIRYDVIDNCWNWLSMDYLESLRMLHDEDIDYLVNNILSKLKKSRTASKNTALALKIASSLMEASK